MISRNLYLQLIIRVILISALGIGAGWLWATNGFNIWLVIILITDISLIANLVHFLNDTNRKISYFLEAVQNNDSSLRFPENVKTKTISELYHGLNKVNEQIQQLKIESRQREQYFQTLLEHLATGIVTFNQKGFVLHANTSAKTMLGMEVLTHISQTGRINRNLFQAIQNIRPFEQKLVTLTTEKGAIDLSMKANSIKTATDELMLLSIQDIRNELDEKELDSWMKLIRVLMHEIMNSIAPITSLAESLSKFYSKDGREVFPSEIDEKTIGMTVRGLNVINEQGNGLMHFVESYRKLTRLPKPDKKRFRVEELVNRVKMLYLSFENSEHVKLQVSIQPPDLELTADENLISQVLLNLLKNALEAIAKQPDGRIQIIARLSDKQRTEISVVDNGPGIPDEIIEQVFVPFFTTREKGSGIGLSLSRQIMRLHGGSLKLVSAPGKKTQAILEF
ncbi:MAG: GHKL domain-containing protein [Bacteroidia bacterium]|nr:GHKL domain-containing protein [Bacteroidia bacterium]